MSSRDDVVRLAILASSYRKTVSSLPCSTAQDARRWVRFACRCVINEDGLPALFSAFELAQLRDDFELAYRWVKGEEISAVQLEQALESTRSQAGTLSSKLDGNAAAHWAIVYAIEAACLAAAAGKDAALLSEVSVAADSAAKYARLAHGADSAVKAIECQRALLSEIFAERVGKRE